MEEEPDVIDGSENLNESNGLVLEGTNVNRLTLEQLDQLPDGTVLTGIDGEKKIKGVDQIDTDTRDGFSAYGFVENDAIPDGIVLQDGFGMSVLHPSKAVKKIFQAADNLQDGESAVIDPADHK